MGETEHRARTGGIDVLGRLADLSGLRLDYAFALLMIWQATGGALDIRKHAAGFSFAEEGLVTFEHTMMWTGFVVLLGLLFGVTIARRYRRNLSWIEAIPPGYELGFLGMLLWALAVPADLTWHVAFGIEQHFRALLSPTHLALGVGAALFLSSPLRAAWRRTVEGSWRTLFPSVVAATFTLGVVTMFTMYAHPTYLFAGVTSGDSQFVALIGVTAFLVQMAVVAGLCCLLVRRFAMPFGAFTVILAQNGLIMVGLGATNDAAAVYFMAVYLFAGLVADVLAWRFGRLAHDTARLRLFCVAVPVAWALAHFAVVEFFLGGIDWVTHTWTGTVVLAGAAGFVVSVLAAPSPYDPARRRATAE